MTERSDGNAMLGGLATLAGGLAVTLLVGLLRMDPSWVTPHVQYKVVLDHGFGVQVSMPVTIAGREVGFVDEVVLGNDRNVRLSLQVDERYAHHVHVDSHARVLQLVSGRYVEIVGGRGDPLPPGGELFYGRNHDVLLTLADVDLPATLAQISDLIHDLARVMESADLENEDLSALVEALATVARQVESGEGTLGRVVHDEALYERSVALLTEVEGLAVESRALVREVEGVAGAVGDAAGTVVAAGGAIESASGSLEASTAQIDQTLRPLPEVIGDLEDALGAFVTTMEAIQRLPLLKKQVGRVEAEATVSEE